jgi:hypothetical protein
MNIHNDEKTSFSGVLGRFGILSETRIYTDLRTHYQTQQERDTRKGEEEYEGWEEIVIGKRRA